MSPRRMEEASVAGESPDKSKQRKSSGTAEERDPRFAVLREPPASVGAGSADAGSAARGATGAGAETATAVFRTPRPADTDSAGMDGADTDGADTDGAETDGAETDGAETDGAETDGAETDGHGDRDGVAEASGSPSEPAAPATGAGRSTGGADDSGSGSDSDPGSGAGEVTGRPERASASGGGVGDAEAGPEASEEASAGLKAASGDEAGSRNGSGDGSASTTASSSGASAASVASESSDEGSAPQAKPREGGGPEPEAAAEAEPASGVRSGSRSEPDADADAEGNAPDLPVSAPGQAAVRDSTPEPDSKPEPGSGEREGADTPRVPRSREEVTTSEESAPREETADASDEDRAETSEPAEGKRGTDQATAVFKTRPSPQVDQPTTTLKLPPRAAGAKTGTDTEPKTTPAAGAGSKPAPGTTATPAKPTWAARATGSDAPGTPGASGTAETPAERTSKFVPLRSDVRPAPAAPRGPGAATGGPAGPPAGPPTPPVPPTPSSPETTAGSAGTAAGYVEAERTRQQPMPPKPPLDLLAELTNTPPPPETPVRTAVRRVKIWTPLVLLLLIVFAIAQVVRPLPDPTLTLSAGPTYTFGGEKLVMPWPEEGQGAVEVEGVGTIGSYGKQKPAPIASMAKVMTAYVILQGHPLTGEQTGERITVDKRASEEAAIDGESVATVKEGDTYTEHQMLQLLMIPSGNNVARLLARWDATTEEAFVEKMNAAAKDLGMTGSTYTDPSGLKSTTVSTPADQIKLGNAVMQNDVFREIVDMPQTDIPGLGRIYNNNDILLEPGVNGIKTGSSTPAGGNLLWTASTVVDGKNRRIIGVVMGADMDGRLYDKLQRALQNSLKLIKTAQQGVDSATVVKKGQVVGHVDNGFGARVPVVATKNLKAVGWGGLEVDLTLTDGGRTPAHKAAAGTVVGEVSVGTGTGKVSAPVALQSEMTEPTFGDKLTRVS
ncbi:D-alanyl-D-alanine carboxypeptidase [Streptomyces sp. NBC_01754]|uniref:D-alanyl-D-alanine carboxypeptidase n=1 Tax=Streptomyces sp. NBC_01754 TaxID=2975930 RepID=UPI002DD8F2E5|nr:D-alanyl-D-alanine carboxypeptidase [Streptomyces sp. NBC_01754]WSC93058.1 D-alanyl-D-alanine carboxypeptidase [Streptomyces sp. NBC_01754]